MCTSAPPPPPSEEQSKLTPIHLQVGDMERTFYLYVPSTAPVKDANLLIAFHGGGGNALSFEKKAGITAMADVFGFIVAIPEGARRNSFSPRSWNAHSINPSGWAEKNGINDRGFITAIVDYVDAAETLFLMGHSKGGMMAYSYATTGSYPVSAIGVNAATMSERDPGSAGGVRLLHIHGDLDDRVPLAGNDKWPPVMRGIDYFSEVNTPESVILDIVEGGGHEYFPHATEAFAKFFSIS